MLDSNAHLPFYPKHIEHDRRPVEEYTAVGLSSKSLEANQLGTTRNASSFRGFSPICGDVGRMDFLPSNLCLLRHQLTYS